MRRAAILVAGVLAFANLWVAGELHRENCEKADRVSCSVLPWDSGEAKPSPPLTRELCILLNEARIARGERPEDCSKYPE